MFFLLCSDRAQPERTADLTAEAIACAERTGDEMLAGMLHNNAGVYQLRQGNLAAARRHLQRAEEANEGTGQQDPVPVLNLGWVLREGDDRPGAASRFERAVRVSRRVGDMNDLAYATLGLACLASDASEWRRAAVLHCFADSLLARSGEPWQDPEDKFRQKSRDLIRVHLDEAEFGRACAQGTALDVRRGVDFALNRS
jgi:hypothetical protein